MSTTTHRFEVKVEPFMTRQAWNAWFFAGGLAWKAPLAFCVLLLSAFVDRDNGRMSAFSIAAFAVACVVALIGVSAYCIGLRRSMSKLTMIVGGKASYLLSDSTIEASSSLGSIALAWAAVGEVRNYGDLVLLGFRGAMYSVLPAKQIPPAALEFLMGRAREAGAKITA